MATQGVIDAAESSAISVSGNAALWVQITGTFTATLQFEATIDGATWFAVPGYPAASSTPATSSTGTGQWRFAVAGLSQFRVRASAYTSGTATVSYGLVPYASAVSDVAVLGASTSNIGDVDVLTIAAGETHVGEVGGSGGSIEVTLSLDTSAYSSGDVLADTQVITNAVRVAGGRGYLHSMSVYDQDDQGVAFDVYILSANVSMGTENAAPSISDSDGLKVRAIVPVATTDYKDLGGIKYAQIRNIGAGPIIPDSGRDLYVAVVNGTGTPTYTASGVRLRFSFLWD